LLQVAEQISPAIPMNWPSAVLSNSARKSRMVKKLEWIEMAQLAVSSTVCITNIDWKKWRHEKQKKTQNHEVFAAQPFATEPVSLSCKIA